MATRGHVGWIAGALLMLVAGPAAAQLRTCVRVEPGKDGRRRAGPPGQERARSPPDPPYGGRGLPGGSDRRADRPRRRAGGEMGHRAHQHAGAVSREGGSRRHRSRGAAAADGRPQQRSADPEGARVQHLAAAPGPRAGAAERDALRRRALRAGIAAGVIARHIAGRGVHRPPRGQRAARRRAAGRRVQSGQRARPAAPARAVRRPDRGGALRLAGEDTSLFASALVGLVHYRFEGPAPFDGSGRDRHRDQLGPVARACAAASSDAHRRRPRAGVPAAHPAGLHQRAIPTAASSTSGCPASPSAPASSTDPGPLAPRSGERVRERGPPFSA